jgi:queuine tRNA-ribosyltransferase
MGAEDTPRCTYQEFTRDGWARLGRLSTRKGLVDTPAFMPVGTAGTVKGMLPEEVSELGAQIILGNTYHLMVRPGVEMLGRMGGLHGLMGWHGPILTDSGGFQVFSLTGLRKVSEEGVVFQSHLDGAKMELTPERCIQAQELIGSDIMMCLDECPPAGASREYLENCLERDARWAARAKAARTKNGGAMFGIVQGGVHPDLRAKSAGLLMEQGFDGYALGGLSVGEDKEDMLRAIEDTVPLLPADKPVYLMGVGEPVDLVNCSGLGVDMFDCVLPTRMARNGTLLTSGGRLNIRNSRFSEDKGPVELGCGCYTCNRYSRAYLRHLFMSKELLAYRLNTIHNLYYVQDLMRGIRQAIKDNTYQAFSRSFFAKLEAGVE